MRLIASFLATLVLTAAAGFWLAGFRGSIVLMMVSILLWLTASLRSRAIIYRAMGVTRLQIPVSLKNTWMRAEESRGQKITEELVVSSEAVPDALFFMTLSGRRHLILTEGLLRGLSETEVRAVLNQLADSFRFAGVRTSGVAAVWSYWFWNRIPKSCRASLFQGQFHHQVTPFDVFRSLLIHPLMKWFLPRVQPTPGNAPSAALNDALQKSSSVRAHLQARRPSCWDALSLFQSDPLLSAFELVQRQR